MIKCKPFFVKKLLLISGNFSGGPKPSLVETLTKT